MDSYQNMDDLPAWEVGQFKREYQVFVYRYTLITGKEW